MESSFLFFFSFSFVVFFWSLDFKKNHKPSIGTPMGTKKIQEQKIEEI
jgi:hypothetical protein